MTVEEMVLAELGVTPEEAEARLLLNEYVRADGGLTAGEVLWVLANVIHGREWMLARVDQLAEHATRDRNEGRREALRWACR